MANTQNEAKKIIDQAKKQAGISSLATEKKVETKASAPEPTEVTTQTENPTGAYEVGYVISTRNYLLLMNGLPSVRINEIVVNKEGIRGLVTGLQDNTVEVLLLDDTKIEPNEQFFKTGRQLSLDAGDHLVSRVINPLGIPIDGKGRFTKATKQMSIYKVATGIKSRQFIKNQFETGITTVDSLIPLAKGQRELVLGSARSGKSGFLIDVIVNQKKRNITCVVVLIGKPLTEIRRIVDVLTINKAIEYTAVIASSSSDPASMVYIAPYVGFTVAEYFQQQGKDVLVILDDLGLHAKYYREISLLSNRAPSRESYPGDIFSVHAALLERAGNFRDEYGGGSITALPVIETVFNDFASFIPTNLMAMTDGHLMFDYDLYHRGYRPAINIPLSVSRVGRQTQTIIQKVLADAVKSILAQSKRLESLSRFGSEVSQQTQELLNQGQQIDTLLAQKGLTFIPVSIQVLLVGLIFTPFLMKQNSKFVEENKDKIIDYFNKNIQLEQVATQTAAMKTMDELIKLLQVHIPNLEKLCPPPPGTAVQSQPIPATTPAPTTNPNQTPKTSK